MTYRPLRRAPVALTLLASALLAACSPAPVSRNAPPQPQPIDVAVEPITVSGLSNFSVAQISVSVPPTLQVSERNSYYPGGDIVWHGDPAGNRHEQVKAIFEAGLTAGTREFTGDRPVIVDVVVTRFHALSPRARYTIGGVHSVQFHLRVRDANTGAVLVPSYHVRADIDAYGGATALAAEAHGDTQKVRLTRHLASVIARELRQPGSVRPEGTGVIGAINQL
ncbi:MAG: DUF6778 family protein [Pseudomonadota bacterium]